MKRYTGRHLFPDQNQVYRIRRTVLEIQEELSERYGKHISFLVLANLLNDQLAQVGWLEEIPVSDSKLSRLSRFGKGDECNNIKLLEVLPLLHLVSSKYSEEDLKRIALGQPLTKEERSTTLYPQEINELKTRIFSVLAYVDELTNPNLMQVAKDVSVGIDEKRFIFERLITYKDNFNLVKEMGLLNMDEIEQYLESDIPDDVIVAMLALCEIPGPVRLLLAKKEPTLKIDSIAFNNHEDEVF